LEDVNISSGDVRSLCGLSHSLRTKVFTVHNFGTLVNDDIGRWSCV